MNLLQWFQSRDDLANVDIRWPGMSQDNCPVRIDSPPTLTVDTPGAGYGVSGVGGAPGGSFQPRGPTDAVSVPGLPHISPPQYRPSLGPDSGGQPSGATGNVFTPTANTDRIPRQVIPPFRNGSAERSFVGDDVQSPSRSVSNSGTPALILERIGPGAPRGPSLVGLCQPGQMPPTMASHSVTVQRRSGDTFSPIPVGGRVAPGEAIRYRSDGGNLPFDTVKFRVIDMLGGIVFEFTANLNSLLSGWVDTVAPAIEGVYTLTAEVRTFPFLTVTHFADTFFVVDQDAPPPPSAPPSGGAFLGDLRGIIIALTVLAGVVIIAPRIVPRRE